MLKTSFTLALSGTLLLLASCTKKADYNYYYYNADDYKLISQSLNLPAQPDDYSITLPSNLSASGLFPRPVNTDRAILGRVLFYDKSLSKDGSVACATCHKQELGFGDNTPTSKGVYKTVGDRNSISLASVTQFSAYYGTDFYGSTGIHFFWDNRAATAVEQCTGSMTNPKEMDVNAGDIEATVQRQPFYEPLFNKAFGDPTITADRIKECISNFVNSMGSYNSRFDAESSKLVNGGGYGPVNTFQDFSAFSSEENKGKQIYMNACSSCHSADMGRPVQYKANNGLDATDTSDKGVGQVTGDPNDYSMFKVPTLRNITLTAPYMHDGRFKTLEEVIEHYNSGIQPHPNLNKELKSNDGSPKRFNWSDADKKALIAFLATLQDDKVLADVRFSDPFKH